jgi:hypothetical protein
MPSEQEFTELQAAVIALHERMAQAEAALVMTRQILEKLVELTDSLHRRLSRFRDAAGPQPPLTGAN